MHLHLKIMFLLFTSLLLVKGMPAPEEITEKPNGPWPTIPPVGECVDIEIKRECYGCGKDANSVEVYRMCCERNIQTVNLCNGVFETTAPDAFNSTFL